jgi:hypothetical protein
VASFWQSLVYCCGSQPKGLAKRPGSLVEPAGKELPNLKWGPPDYRLAGGPFITGSDFLMDGGVTAAYSYGELEAEMTSSILRAGPVNVDAVSKLRRRK